MKTIFDFFLWILFIFLGLDGGEEGWTSASRNFWLIEVKILDVFNRWCNNIQTIAHGRTDVDMPATSLDPNWIGSKRPLYSLDAVPSSDNISEGDKEEYHVACGGWEIHMLETLSRMLMRLCFFHSKKNSLGTYCCAQFLVSSSLQGPCHIAHRAVTVIIGMCMKDCRRSNTRNLVQRNLAHMTQCLAFLGSSVFLWILDTRCSMLKKDS